jgi:hypothetical protein
MSAGSFEAGKYSSDGGVVFGCTAQPESKGLTLATVANAYPTGVVTSPVSAKLSGGKRKIGLTARTVSIRFTAAPPTGYATNAILRIPVFTSTAYNAYVKGATGTYLATACVVVGRSPERIR